MFCSQCGSPADAAAAACAQCGFDFAVARPAINAERVGAASRDAFRAITLLLRDPVGSIGAAYDAFTPRQVLDVGITLCAAFIVSCVIATRMIAGAAQRFGGGFVAFNIGFKEVITTLLVGSVPVGSIVAILTFLQVIAKKPRDLRRALFAGGAALVPMAFLNVLGGILGMANAEVLMLVGLFVLCYTVLLIYAGCHLVIGISSAWSAAAVPVVVIATAWLTKIILVAMM